MKVEYDPEVDILLITLKEEKPVHGEDAGEGIIIHFSEENEPLEIEILDAKEKLLDWLSAVLKARAKA